MSAGALAARPARLSLGGGWRPVLIVGLAGAAIAMYLGLVGLVGTFHQQQLVARVLTLGQALLLLNLIAAGYFGARRARGGRATVISAGVLAGLLTGLGLAALVIAGSVVELRTVFRPASPQLFNIITLDGFADLGIVSAWVPLVAGGLIGAGAGVVAVLPRPVQRAFGAAILAVMVFGVFAGIVRTPMLGSELAGLARTLFASQGLQVHGAVVVLAGALGLGIGEAIGARLGGRRGGAVGGVLGGVLVALAGGAVGGANGALVGGVIGIVVGGAIGGALQQALQRPEVSHAVEALPQPVHAAGRGAVLLLLLLLIAAMPHMAGTFFASVVALVALYIMMGLGLNITLGLAGLLDLGFVAFFAVGAYTVGLLTSLGEFGLFSLPRVTAPTPFVVAIAVAFVAAALTPRLARQFKLTGSARVLFGLGVALGSAVIALLLFTLVVPLGGSFLFGPFWFAIPFAVLLAFIFGAFLGLPVLGIRGDYLAIATLGFGEIIALLVRSNLLIEWLGGPQGVTLIPKPIEVPPTDPLAGPNQIYYIALAFAAFIAFVAYRLRDSRLGRAWLAIREDEDVAEALGINLVQTKLLAYSIGAAFAGLGGALFAAHIGAVFPSSINLFVSINVAALIIVGGMGSIPGVVLGAIFLIGLPELLRDVGGTEYRFLFYGIALILIMRFRPEGLWPSQVIERELHVEENVVPAEGVEGADVATREAGFAKGDYPPETDPAHGEQLTTEPLAPDATELEELEPEPPGDETSPPRGEG